MPVTLDIRTYKVTVPTGTSERPFNGPPSAVARAPPHSTYVHLRVY